MENKSNKICNIKYGSKIKEIILPEKYNIFLEEIYSLFNIPVEQKSNIIININKLSKIENSEQYYNFLNKILINEKPEITISLKEDDNKLLLQRKELYDKDEKIILKNKNESFGEESIDLERLLNESFDFINPIVNKSEINKNIVRFSSYCNICNKFPIINTMYYCQSCDLNLCETCEKKVGYNHRHCYYKIKNKEQYEEILNIKIDEIKKNRNINLNNTKHINNENNGIINSIIGIIMKK